MHPLTLRFADRDLERRFRDSYWVTILPFARFCCFWSIVLWTVFGSLDPIVSGPALEIVWTIRFLIALPIGLILLACSTVVAKSARAKVALFTCIYFVGGASIVLMIAALQPPAAHWYYAGVMLVVFVLFVGSQLRFVHSTIAAFTLIVAYEWIAVFVNHTSIDVLANNSFFLVFGAFIGMIASYVIERYRRTDYLQRIRLAELGEELERLSARDPLTGLFNRRQLASHLENALQTFRRYDTPASIMLIDLDDFKEINDRYGHLAGDELLQRIARVTTATVRKSDLTFRYGGDEFLVLLPATALEEAQDLARGLIDRCQSFGHSSGRFDDAPGISVGVAAIDDGTGKPEDLLSAADRALYAAKQRGKGCVVVAGATS